MLTLGGKSGATENLFRIAIHMKQFWEQRIWLVCVCLFSRSAWFGNAAPFSRNQFHQIDFRPNTHHRRLELLLFLLFLNCARDGYEHIMTEMPFFLFYVFYRNWDIVRCVCVISIGDAANAESIRELEKKVLKEKCTMPTGLDICELKNVPLKFDRPFKRNTHAVPCAVSLPRDLNWSVCELWTDRIFIIINKNTTPIIIIILTF